MKTNTNKIELGIIDYSKFKVIKKFDIKKMR